MIAVQEFDDMVLDGPIADFPNIKRAFNEKFNDLKRSFTMENGNSGNGAGSSESAMM